MVFFSDDSRKSFNRLHPKSGEGSHFFYLLSRSALASQSFIKKNPYWRPDCYGVDADITIHRGQSSLFCLGIIFILCRVVLNLVGI